MKEKKLEKLTKIKSIYLDKNLKVLCFCDTRDYFHRKISTRYTPCSIPKAYPNNFLESGRYSLDIALIGNTISVSFWIPNEGAINIETSVKDIENSEQYPIDDILVLLREYEKINLTNFSDKEKNKKKKEMKKEILSKNYISFLLFESLKEILSHSMVA